METEPVRIIGAINGALTATLAVLTLLKVFSPEVAGSIGIALAAWLQVAANLIVRPRVASPLTQENLQKEIDELKAA